MNTNAEMSHAITANTDAVMAFSNIMISSAEQLTTLNLSATRRLLEESAAAAASMLESNGSMPSSKQKKATHLGVSDSAAAYFQSAQEIAKEAQDAIAKVMSNYLAAQSNGSSRPAEWLKGFDAFKAFGQPFYAFSEANRKAMTDVTSRLVNQTNGHSRKSA